MFMVPTKLALKFSAEADNTNKERYAFLFGQSQVRMTTAGLHRKLVRRDITRSKVCSCCRSTHCWAATELLSSGMVVFTWLTPKRGSPAPEASRRTFFPSHSCWQMGLLSFPEWPLVAAVQFQQICLLEWVQEWVQGTVPHWGIEGFWEGYEAATGFVTGDWTGSTLEQSTYLQLFRKHIIFNQSFLAKWRSPLLGKKQRPHHETQVLSV